MMWKGLHIPSLWLILMSPVAVTFAKFVRRRGVAAAASETTPYGMGVEPFPGNLLLLSGIR
jgi:hypothetical protein